MKKVIDHQVTGKSKMIRGRGRKKETPLSEFEDVKTNAYDNRVDDKYFQGDIDPKIIEKNNSKISKKTKKPKSVKKVNKYLASVKQIVLSSKRNGHLDEKDIIDKLDEIKKICMN